MTRHKWVKKKGPFRVTYSVIDYRGYTERRVAIKLPDGRIASDRSRTRKFKEIEALLMHEYLTNTLGKRKV